MIDNVSTTKKKSGIRLFHILLPVLTFVLFLAYKGLLTQIGENEQKELHGKYKNAERGLGLEEVEVSQNQLKLKLFTTSDFHNGFTAISVPFNLNSGSLANEPHFKSFKGAREKCYEALLTLKFAEQGTRAIKRKWEHFFIEVKRGRLSRTKRGRKMVWKTSAINILDWIEIKRESKSGRLKSVKFHSQRPDEINFKWARDPRTGISIPQDSAEYKNLVPNGR